MLNFGSLLILIGALTYNKYRILSVILFGIGGTLFYYGAKKGLYNFIVSAVKKANEAEKPKPPRRKLTLEEKYSIMVSIGVLLTIVAVFYLEDFFWATLGALLAGVGFWRMKKLEKEKFGQNQNKPLNEK